MNALQNIFKTKSSCSAGSLVFCSKNDFFTRTDVIHLSFSCNGHGKFTMACIEQLKYLDTTLFTKTCFQHFDRHVTMHVVSELVCSLTIIAVGHGRPLI